MADHRGDEACLMVQEHNARRKGLTRAGNTFRTQEKAGVPFTYIVHAFAHHADQDVAALDYVRCAPEWAVWVAERTILDADERVVILEHCLEHEAARTAVDSARRLGVFKGRRVSTKTQTPKDRRALRDFFTHLMLLTDDAEDGDEGTSSEEDNDG
jgi:hypothetical protein